MQRIIDNGHGYAVGADVFFDVASLPGYGKLSGRSQVRTHCGVWLWFRMLDAAVRDVPVEAIIAQLVPLPIPVATFT